RKMLKLRNLLFAVLALVVLISFTAQAGPQVVTNQDGTIVAVYSGPGKAGAGTITCATITNCNFFRDPMMLDPMAPAITLTTSADNTTVFVAADFFAAARCGPDPTMPDAHAEGTLLLPTAGQWSIFMRLGLDAGTTFSQRWVLVDNDTGIQCGPGFCVNSVAGTAPGDCDQM